jgi:flagellar motility protein MotE (MotC chaperone)
MEYTAIEVLRERHPAWRLLRAGNSTLILSFLGEFFVEGNRGACPASEVGAALDDHLYALNAEDPTENGQERYPKDARSYLEDWAATDAAYLRRFYPPGDDEVHYEMTPAFEKAYAWVLTLKGRSFVGTESRLHTVVELLRQIVHGTEVQPDIRLAELRRRRDELDTEIATVEAGFVQVLDATGVRDRYQQLATTARELLSDFREVEENFRLLDRAAREKIAAWDGSKGELVAELVGSRSESRAQTKAAVSRRSTTSFSPSRGRPNLPNSWPRFLPSRPSKPIIGSAVFTTTGPKLLIGPSAPSGRYPNS